MLKGLKLELETGRLYLSEVKNRTRDIQFGICFGDPIVTGFRGFPLRKKAQNSANPTIAPQNRTRCVPNPNNDSFTPRVDVEDRASLCQL